MNTYTYTYTYTYTEDEGEIIYDAIGENVREHFEDILCERKGDAVFIYKLTQSNEPTVEGKIELVENEGYCYDSIGEIMRDDLEDKINYTKGLTVECSLTYV